MSGLLTFLLDRDDLACLEALCPAALSGTIVAFDPDLHIELLSREVAHVTPWSFVGSAELDAVREFEQVVWEFWQANASAPFAGMDLLHMVSFRHRSCFSRIAWAAFVIRRVFEEVHPREVAVFEEPTGHGLEQPPEHNKMPLLQALVRGAAEQDGVAVRLLRRGEVPGHGEFVDWTAKKSAATLPRVDLEVELQGRPYVLMPGSGVDLLRPLRLARALLSEGELAVVQLYKSSPARPEVLEQAQDAGHFVWHESQVVGNADPSAAACFEGSRDRFDQARRCVPRRLRSIFANPYLDIHFDFIFGEYLAKMAWNVRVWQSFLERHPPQMLVSTSYTPVNDVAHALGIPCLGLPHGSMMVGHTRWFECYETSLIGAISDPHRERLIRAGLEADRIVVTGDPGLDELLRSAEADTPPTDQASKMRAQWGVRSAQRAVLVVMGNMGMLAKLGGLPLYDWAASVRQFRELGEFARRHSDWRFIVRPHPRYDHPGLTELVNRTLPAEQQLIVCGGEPLDRVMPGIDAVVVWNIVTAAILECSLWSKPVLLLSGSMVWCDPHDWATNYWRHLPSVPALEDELHSIFEDARQYDRAVRRTGDAVEQYLAGVDQPAVLRCVDVISECVGRPMKT